MRPARTCARARVTRAPRRCALRRARGSRGKAGNTPRTRRHGRRTENRTRRGATPLLKLASARMPRSAASRLAFYVLFTVSGFAGLIYESIWTQYLKLFLGHAAYAQSLVLAVFMGGMAAGAWLVSRFTRRIANLLLGYAAAELGIG